MFEGIKARLKDKAKDVKTIRVYAGQDLFSEDARTIAYPAVFISWENFEIEPRGYNTKYGEGNVVVRVATQFLSEDPLVCYDMETQVMIALEGYNDWGGNIMENVENEVDETSDSLYVGKLYFNTNYLEDITPDWEICDETTAGQLALDLDLTMDSNGDGVYTKWDDDKFMELITNYGSVIITQNGDDIILIT